MNKSFQIQNGSGGFFLYAMPCCRNLLQFLQFFKVVYKGQLAFADIFLQEEGIGRMNARLKTGILSL
ncbi:hypothetical protein G159_19610 [Planococcus glaciei CHR43]|nr:hypothetical protein G159_19610 [Planococcus glaciei CHR43]